MSELLLEARNVSKAYSGPAGPVKVLRDVCLTLWSGQMACIKGPSGSGKTTLLGCLSGLLPPDGGFIHFKGHDLGSLSRAERANLRRTLMGFVFQSGNLFPYLTATENAALPLILRGIRAGKAMGQAREALASLGLGDRLSHTPARMSGGEQQRVAVARAALSGASIVFADEPTGSLDEANAEAVASQLLGLRSRGIGMLVVSHNPLFERVSDVTMTLRGGVLEVEASGAPSP